MVVGGTALFGGGRGGAAQSKAMVEFRAGKMTTQAGSNLVSPDKRKGLIQIEQGEDQLMHFKWKDRGTGVVEDDLIIFPDDIEFVRVKQCTTGRVFVLKFKSSSRRMFFWMQEPKEDKDEEYCKKVNDCLNKPPGSDGGSSGGLGSGGRGGLSAALGGGGPVDLSSLGDGELQSLLGNMSQQQLVQLFSGGLGGLANSGILSNRSNRDSPSTPSTRERSETSAATTAPVPATTTEESSSRSKAAASDSAAGAAGNVPIQLMDLQSVLSGIKVPSSSKEPPVDLSSGVTGEVIKPLLNNPEFVQKMKELLPLSEETVDPANEISSTISSPQFKQALQMFSSGLQSGQLGPLIREFGLGDAAVAAATAGNMESFIKAVQDSKKEGQSSDASAEGDAKPKKDEDFALD